MLASNVDHDVDKFNKLWLSVHINLINKGLIPISFSFDGARRVYADDNYVYKITLTAFDQTGHLRRQSLQGEYLLLLKCSGVSGVPEIISYENNDIFAMLKMRRIYGTPLNKVQLNGIKFSIIVIKVGKLVFRLAIKGIVHNDVKLDNILLCKDNKVYLIDFDQAISTTFIEAFLKSFFIRSGKGEVVHSYLYLLKESIKRILPPNLIRVLKLISGRKVLDDQLPVLPKNASKSLQNLLDAWRIAQISEASSPGAVVAYYSFKYEGVRFPGEREWPDRWSILQNITNYENKRILELGCNMALLSAHLLKYAKASAAMCVDIDDNILQSATLVSSALGVKPIFRQQNLDAPDSWENELAAFKPDIVFALNVLNWVENKDRLMRFLGIFNEVIFEGHNSVEVEMFRFQEVGFTKINLVTVTERNRPVLHCCK